MVVLTPTPSATPSGGTAVWVLSPVGLNLRAGPTATAARVATLARGVQLEVLSSQAAGGRAWLRVRSSGGSGTEGWVLDDPELLIHRPVTAHIDSTAGWSLLFPSEWTLNTGAPTEFRGQAEVLQVWSAADSKSLPPPPGTPGREVRDEGPVVVFSTTTFLTVYQLDAGGFEFDVRIKAAEGRYYEFRLRQAGPTADTSLYRQILAGVAFS